MKKHLLTLASVLLACTGRPAPAPAVPQPFVLGHVAITPLGRGVFAATRVDEPLGLAQNANSLFIVGDSGVVVVDAQFTRAATLENLAALRRITTKPVRYVITTHWHDDHFAGSQVYQDTFPAARFLAHANTRADLIAKGRPNRAQQVQFAPGALDRYARLLDMGLGGDSTPVSPLERAATTNAIRIARQYLAEAPTFREVLPDTITGARMSITDGSRVIELRWFGRGATRGDLVTWLPNEGIVATGDVVDIPVPFGFASYPSEWIGVLDSIAALRPRVILPGHGPVLRDRSQLVLIRSILVAARDRVRPLVAAGATRDSVLNVVRLDDFRSRVGEASGIVDEKWLNVVFRGFFVRPVVASEYDSARAPSK